MYPEAQARLIMSVIKQTQASKRSRESPGAGMETLAQRRNVRANRQAQKSKRWRRNRIGDCLCRVSVYLVIQSQPRRHAKIGILSRRTVSQSIAKRSKVVFL